MTKKDELNEELKEIKAVNNPFQLVALILAHPIYVLWTIVIIIVTLIVTKSIFDGEAAKNITAVINNIKGLLK
jgi:hypothetical protein